MNKNLLVLIFFFSFLACGEDNSSADKHESSVDKANNGTYGYDASFMKQYNRQVIELESEDGYSKVLLSAAYQGRVMTSTSRGDSGNSYGWINYDLIAAGQPKKQFNPVGGEERFWLGPEGGQYALYFKKGDSFNIASWQVPPLLDTVTYDIRSSDKVSATFSKNASITNFSGTTFDCSIERKIVLLNRIAVEQQLQVHIPGSISMVAYASENNVRNTGRSSWTKEKGLLSIWLLGMFNPSPQTTVIIPFKPSAGADRLITDDYFGKIPPGRLQINDSILFFSCDGKYRSKIGLSPLIAKPLAGSYDFSKNVLTIISFPVHPHGMYVNSKWEQQAQPYKGDVVNAYNDGPLPDGSQLGMFYELESSSPAVELSPGASITHRQVTCHFEGSYSELQTLALQLLGVRLDAVKQFHR